MTSVHICWLQTNTEETEMTGFKVLCFFKLLGCQNYCFGGKNKTNACGFILKVGKYSAHVRLGCCCWPLQGRQTEVQISQVCMYCKQLKVYYNNSSMQMHENSSELSAFTQLNSASGSKVSLKFSVSSMLAVTLTAASVVEEVIRFFT